MKIAVLSPQPRTSGVVTYSHHLARGFENLGHDCQVVTFTLSGKPSAAFTAGPVDAKGVVRSGWGWSPLGFDRCDRWDRAAEVLDEYDVIVMEEPRCAPLDKRALRKAGDGDIKFGRHRLSRGDLPHELLPPYIQALEGLGQAKIAVVLHDPGYGFRLAPFLDEFMRYVQPDAIITHRDGALESAAWAGVGTEQEARIAHLPYAARGSLRRRWHDEPWPSVIGMTGRYINNKGQPTLALAAAMSFLPVRWDVDIAGASPLGAGPNHTFLTFEGLTKEYGFEGTRDGSDVTRGWPWRANKLGDTIQYSGPYDDPVEKCLEIGVHVNATDAAFSGGGSVEYSTLEAMDAGCVIVAPETATPKEGAPSFFPFKIEKLANAELKPVGAQRSSTAMNLGYAAHRGVLAIEHGEARAMADANYDVLAKWHAPSDYARKVLEALT